MNPRINLKADHMVVNLHGTFTPDCLAGIVTSATETQTGERLEWSRTLCDGERVTFEQAQKACAELGEGWHLPTRMELESILDLTRHDPAIDTERFPDTKSASYWTGTPCAWLSGYAWIVNFNLGGAHDGRYDYGACVRAVRSVPAASNSAFLPL